MTFRVQNLIIALPLSHHKSNDGVRQPNDVSAAGFTLGVIRSRWEQILRENAISIADLNQGVSHQAIVAPLVHRNGAKRPIEINGRLIPVQDGPFQMAAAPRD